MADPHPDARAVRGVGPPRAWQRVLGYVAALLLMLEGVLHSVAGWPAVHRELSTAHVSAAFSEGLAVPWHLAGSALVMLGCMAGWCLLRSSEEWSVTRRLVGGIGVYLTAFAIVGAAAIKADPTFLMFGVPGIMLIASAAWASRSA